MPQFPYFKRKSKQYPLNRRLDELCSRSRCSDEEEKTLILVGYQIMISQLPTP